MNDVKIESLCSQTAPHEKHVFHNNGGRRGSSNDLMKRRRGELPVPWREWPRRMRAKDPSGPLIN